MPNINYQVLEADCKKHGSKVVAQELSQALTLGAEGKPGGLRPQDFSIRQLAEAFNGRAWVDNLDPRNQGSFLESGSAVDSTAFSNITGQLMVNQVMEGYRNEAFVFSRLFRTIPTRLSGEKIPGITMIGDKAQAIQEGMPYPHVGVGEDYIETPATVKDGLILPVTREAIFFDRTGLLLQNASQVGEALGLRKEKNCIKIFTGETTAYKWKGTSYATYQTSTPWINKLAGSTYALADWTTVEKAESLFNDMLDPNTSEPILISALTLITSPALKHTANRILNATEIRQTAGSSLTLSGNPLAGGGYNAEYSRLLYRTIAAESSGSAAKAAATWFLGDVSKAFAYMENWPITVTQAPQNSEAEFTQDIVLRYKASERGAGAVLDPRFVVRVNGHD